MKISFSNTSNAVLLLLFAGSLATNVRNCKDVVFTVSASAQNLDLSNIDITNFTSITTSILRNNFSLISISGTESIAGTYCEPASKNANSTKLQMFFSSITGNRGHFSALGGLGVGFPSYESQIYSFVEYATGVGYSTLAIDRLGTGKSSHPDPILKVQASYEVALYHQIAASIRAGIAGQIPRYTCLIYIGNSYGSQLGSKLAHEYPNDFDMMVLTGFSKSVLPSLPGVSLQAPVPAALHDPARFGALAPGYLTASIQSARTNSFFGNPSDVDFDPQVAKLFYEREDVISIGQFISLYTITTSNAPEYTKRVLVLTGEQDQAFCGLGSSALGPAKCGSLLADTKSLFPRADYSYYSVPRTGHATSLHKSAQNMFKVAHDFLGGRRFAQ